MCVCVCVCVYMNQKLYSSENIISYISVYCAILYCYYRHATSHNNINQICQLLSKWPPQSAVPSDMDCTARSLLHVAISLRKEWHSAGKEPGTVSMYGRRTSLYRAFRSCALSAFVSVAASGCHLRAALHPNLTHDLHPAMVMHLTTFCA